MVQNPTAIVIPSLIVGLGNPGKQYDRTRHNIGFDLVDTLAQRWQIALTEQRRFQGYLGEGMGAPGQKVRLLKPTTYMNRSGQAVRAVVDWFKLNPEQVLVVYDDMDLPLGRLRLRLKGSSGGHNGMKSIISHLGTQTFPRLRLGIGAPSQDDRTGETISHVLGKFAPQEREVVEAALDHALKAVDISLKQGVEMAMNRFNG